MNIKDATEQEKTAALAEMDGRKGSVGFDSTVGYFTVESGVGTSCNYLTSYDAIIPLIQKQDRDIQWQIWDDRVSLPTMSPQQLADALLVASGKMIL